MHAHMRTHMPCSLTGWCVGKELGGGMAYLFAATDAASPENIGIHAAGAGAGAGAGADAGATGGVTWRIDVGGVGLADAPEIYRYHWY